MNNDLRKKIVRMITNGGEGHIPSSFSIVDIIATLFDGHLNVDPDNPDWDDRDYFVLSKGHGCAGLYVVLEKHGFITQDDLDSYGQFEAILGGHPDRTKVPGVEASTGSLGHGLPFSLGIALGLKIQNKESRVFTLVGDGECHEGTIWESALVAQNLRLSNLCCIVDLNGSAAQILPHPDITKQWTAFGWNVLEVDGHSKQELDVAFDTFKGSSSDKPSVIIAHTVKGKGVSFLESHGPWHHKIPNESEFDAIMNELSL
jgi:transketolase